MQKIKEKERRRTLNVLGETIMVKVKLKDEDNIIENDRKIFMIECPICEHKCYGLTESAALQVLINHLNEKHSLGGVESLLRQFRSYVDFPK